jgi:hypothetical protein
MCGNEPLRDQGHLALSLSGRHTGLEARHGPEAVRYAIVLNRGRRRGERRPDFSGCGELLARRHFQTAWELKTRWHDAYDEVILVVESYASSDHLGIAAEILPPQIISKDSDVISARLLIIRGDRAADEGNDIQDLKKITGRSCALNSNRAGYPCQIETGVGRRLINREWRDTLFCSFQSIVFLYATPNFRIPAAGKEFQTVTIRSASV